MRVGSPCVANCSALGEGLAHPKTAKTTHLPASASVPGGCPRAGATEATEPFFGKVPLRPRSGVDHLCFYPNSGLHAQSTTIYSAAAVRGGYTTVTRPGFTAIVHSSPPQAHRRAGGASTARRRCARRSASASDIDGDAPRGLAESAAGLLHRRRPARAQEWRLDPAQFLL